MKPFEYIVFAIPLSAAVVFYAYREVDDALFYMLMAIGVQLISLEKRIKEMKAGKEKSDEKE